jgi:hypothetical protein
MNITRRMAARLFVAADAAGSFTSRSWAETPGLPSPEQSLVIKSACHDVSVRYTHFIADKTFTRMSEVFAPDGVLEVQGNRNVGAEAIAAFFNKSLSDPGLRVRLMITNELIDVSNSRQAKGKAFFTIYRMDVSKGLSVPSLAPAAMAISEDEYALTSHGWRLTLRRINLLAAAEA